jgi:hypothetical protein
MGVKLKMVPVVVLLGLGVSAGPAAAATFTVSTVNDTPAAGSLRWAINQSEQQPGRDLIEFDIAGPGPSQATRTRPAEPMIAIDAGNAFRGLDIGADRVKVRGLAVHSAQEVGIFVEGQDIVVAGNHIGVDAGGAVALPNFVYGVEVYGGDNLIGGPRYADRNVISGNGGAEVRVEGGAGHEIEGNRIGTDADGTGVLGIAYGVVLEASGNVVRDNLISGEGQAIEVAEDDNVVQGNLIGTDADGIKALGNGVGVNVEGGDGNLIGGTVAGDANVIAGSTYEGVLIEDHSGEPARGNRVEGNLIGTDTTGGRPLPNGYAGVQIAYSDDNTVGGEVPGSGNVIAYNGGDGVEIVGDTAVENAIVGNAIFANGDGVGDLGIDLNADGITLNDALDADAGANTLQNHPTIVVASSIAAGTKVEWALDSLASTSFRLDFYASDACDDSGHGEGQVHLGSANVVTDAAGQAAANTVPTIAAAPGQQITMTATRGTVAGDTSEFSPCQPVA